MTTAQRTGPSSSVLDFLRSHCWMPARNNPNYGRGVARLDVDDAYFMRGEELTERLLRHFQSPKYQPPTLPRVGMELMSLVRLPEVSLSQVVALCEQDAMVAARVVAAAESAAFRTTVPVRSLKDAALRLGMRNLATIFLEASFRLRVFRAPGFDDWANRVSRHSIATARAARIVCRYTGFPDEYAFMAGLLHDVGIVACLVTLAESRSKARRLSVDLLRNAIDQAHEKAGQKLADLWRLPADLALVMGHHHALVIDGRPHPLAAAVSAAECFAGHLGFDDGTGVDDAQLDRALAILRLSPAQIRLVEKEVKDAVADI